MNEYGYVYCENSPDRALVEANGEEWTAELEKQWEWHRINVLDNFGEDVRRYVRMDYDEWPTGTDCFGGTVVGCHKADMSRALRCCICGGWVRVDPMAATWEKERQKGDEWSRSYILGGHACPCEPQCQSLQEHYANDGDQYIVWGKRDQMLGFRRKGDPERKLMSCH